MLSLRCLRTPYILPQPHDPPTAHPQPSSRGRAASLTLMMLLRRGVARAASRRAASLSAGGPAAPGRATPLRRSLHRPPGAAATQSPEVASGPTRGSSSLPAASGGAEPSLLAAPSAMAERGSDSPRGGGTPGSEVQPLGTGALLHREAARPDFVSPPGCGGGGGNFLERRHLSSRDVRGLWSRRPAVRRGEDGGEDVSRREERRQGEGGVRNVMHTPALRQTKGTGRLAGRPQRPGRVRPEKGWSPATAARRTRHLPRDRDAAAPGSAAAAAAATSTPLCCDREGRLVLTARGDWQASGPLRSLASPTGGRPDQSPLRRGVPEREEWNVFSNWEPAQPGSCTRVGCESTLACAYILRSLDVRHDPGDATKSGGGGEGRGKETFICKQSNLEEMAY